MNRLISDHGAADDRHAQRRKVAEGDALVEQPADAGPGEPRLTTTATLIITTTDAGQSDHRDQRVLSACLPSHGLGNPLSRASLTYSEPSTSSIEDRVIGRRGREIPAEREGRHQQMQAVPAGRGQPAEVDGEEQDEHQPDLNGAATDPQREDLAALSQNPPTRTAARMPLGNADRVTGRATAASSSELAGGVNSPLACV